MVKGACECDNGGHCVSTSMGKACACAGPWGGARCSLYVGHDHACAARACAPPAVCVWGPDPSGAQVLCACLEGASCTPPPSTSAHVASPSSGAGAWAGATVTLLLLAGVTLAVLLVIRRRRRGFMHARLVDNMEVNNPVYHEEEEFEPTVNLSRANGSNRFGSPVYEDMFNHQTSPADPSEHTPVYSPLSVDHADLLSARAVSASSPRSRASVRRPD